MVIALCGICRQPVAGSSIADLSNPSVIMGIYLTHVIDEHWDVVERIRATTGDYAARLALVEELSAEWLRRN